MGSCPDCPLQGHVPNCSSAPRSPPWLQRQPAALLQAPAPKGRSGEEMLLLLLNYPARAQALAPSHRHQQRLRDTAGQCHRAGDIPGAAQPGWIQLPRSPPINHLGTPWRENKARGRNSRGFCKACGHVSPAGHPKSALPCAAALLSPLSPPSPWCPRSPHPVPVQVPPPAPQGPRRSPRFLPPGPPGPAAG